MRVRSVRGPWVARRGLPSWEVHVGVARTRWEAAASAPQRTTFRAQEQGAAHLIVAQLVALRPVAVHKVCIRFVGPKGAGSGPLGATAGRLTRRHGCARFELPAGLQHGPNRSLGSMGAGQRRRAGLDRQNRGGSQEVT